MDLKIPDESLLSFFKQYESPFYFYNGDALRRHITEIRRKLHSSIDIFFSLKSNNNVTLAKMLYLLGCGVEIASKGELMLAVAAGYQTGKIIYSGPGKTEDELRGAIDKSIYCINVECLEELKVIERLAQEYQKKVDIAIRINPDGDFVKSNIKMAGVPRQFGIDESQLDAFFSVLLDCKHVNFMGVHVYSGTQILNPDQIIESFAYTIQLAKRISDKYPVQCKMIDLGGGFGVPYFSHETPLDFNLLANRINQLISGHLLAFPNTRFVIESGRYLIAESGMYVCKVLYTKYSKGEKFVIVDGGMHHHAAATFRGRAMRNNFPIRLIKQDGREGKQTERVNIVGPLCTPEDCLAKNIELPLIEPGDYICILNSGAYGLSYSPIQFLGHRAPMELLLLNHKVHVIREQGKEEDLMLHQKIIDFGVEGI